MKGKFIVIEGVDGCGKSTQLALLREAFERTGRRCEFIHFPRLDKGIYGTLVAEFLRGEYGTLEQVHPKLVALLFANDRMEHKPLVEQWLHEGAVVFADRYVCSNIAYQCAKLPTAEEKTSLRHWILDYEFAHNQLPKPDCSFFLNVPLDFTFRNLTGVREGKDRDYLRGGRDIHEASLDFQRKVYAEYESLLREGVGLTNVRCGDGNGGLLPKEEIHEKLMKRID